MKTLLFPYVMRTAAKAISAGRTSQKGSLAIVSALAMLTVGSLVMVAVQGMVAADGRRGVRHLNSVEGFYATESSSIRKILEIQKATSNGMSYSAWVSANNCGGSGCPVEANPSFVRRFTGGNLSMNLPSAITSAGQNVCSKMKFGTNDSYDTCVTTQVLCDPATPGGVIDFETRTGFTPSEGLSIKDQFATSHGIHFCIDKNGDDDCLDVGEGAPMLVKSGRKATARRAFTCLSPVCTDSLGELLDDVIHNAFQPTIGSYFLADDTTFGSNWTMIITYDTPTAEISGQFLDVEDERVEVTLRTSAASTVDLEKMEIRFGNPNTGDGRLAPWGIRRKNADIGWVRIRNLQNSGLALDNFSPRAICMPADAAQVPFYAAVPTAFDGAARAGAAIEENPTVLNNGVFVGGDFRNYGATAANRIIRLNRDGKVDTTFNSGAGFDGPVNDIKIIYQSTSVSGQKEPLALIALGTFTTYKGVAARGSVRLAFDGSRMGSYSTGTGFVGEPMKLEFLNDGGYNHFIGGAFSRYNSSSVTRGGIVKVDINGADITPSGDMAVGFNGAVTALHVTGAIGTPVLYTGGAYTAYGSPAVGTNRLTKLDLVGSMDISFRNNIGFGPNDIVTAIKTTADGTNDILVGGNFTSFNGSPVNRLIRLRADGTVNPVLQISSGFNGPVYSILPLADGSKRFYVSGSFSQYRGYEVPGMVRLNEDGSIDWNFNIFVYGGAMGTAYWMAPASDSLYDIYAGGTSGGSVLINGVAVPGPGIARFKPDGGLR